MAAIKPLHKALGGAGTTPEGLRNEAATAAGTYDGRAAGEHRLASRHEFEAAADFAFDAYGDTLERLARA